MSVVSLALASLAAFLVLYAIVFFAAGRRSEARALAGFIPDCLILFRRLLGDDRVPRSRRCALGWGKKWGKNPHRSQPIPADLDLAKTA